jgi:hypothetical protein
MDKELKELAKKSGGGGGERIGWIFAESALAEFAALIEADTVERCAKALHRAYGTTGSAGAQKLLRELNPRWRSVIPSKPQQKERG